MAYSKDMDNNTILHKITFDNSDIKVLNVMGDKDTNCGSEFALQLALKDLKSKCARVEEKNIKFQKSEKKLVSELNELKQAKNSWIKEIIDKDMLCRKMQKQLRSSSQDLHHTREKLDAMEKDKSYLESSFCAIKKENEEYERLLTMTNLSGDSNSSPPSKLPQENITKNGSLDEEYHSHNKRPDAPCSCVLAPCATTVDTDSSIDELLRQCRDIKSEITNHTEALSNSITALKIIAKKKRNFSTETCAITSEVEHSFRSNIATYNSETSHLDITTPDVPTGTPPDVFYGRGTVAEVDNADRVCPMCEAIFPTEIPFSEYETHVLNHFNSDGDEIANNFEFL